MNFMNSVVNFFKDGGVFLYPLALIFVVGVSIAIERYVYLTRETFRNRSLWDDLVRSGQQPTTTVLSSVREPAVGEIARKLAVADGAEVIVLERLRYASGEPIARMCNYLPTALSPELTTEALQQRGLYELLRSAGITLHAAAQTIGARTATQAEARMLGEPKGAALLTMERSTYDETGRIIEYGSHIYRASRYSFELSLHAR